LEIGVAHVGGAHALARRTGAAMFLFVLEGADVVVGRLGAPKRRK